MTTTAHLVIITNYFGRQPGGDLVLRVGADADPTWYAEMAAGGSGYPALIVIVPLQFLPVLAFENSTA